MDHKIKILHLEDSINDSELIRSIIENSGIENDYYLVENKNDFTHFLKTKKIDIILSDYSIPGFQGSEALKIAHQNYSHIPFIFVSGTIGEDRAINAMVNGATDYVLKDKLERLVPAIRRALREYELEAKRKNDELELKEKNALIEAQNEEKEKRADELIIANKELTFQNKEKEKRAAELIMANKELVLQNNEKEKRAAELVIANKELAFQNDEKEKRAAELVIANKELAFQNKEKEKRAAELIVAKERAEESDRLKSAFLANMSHEIRTPMNGILGFTGLLTTPNLTGEKQKEYIRIIEKSGERMLNIINDIVSVSKIESGILDINISEYNINDQLEFIYNLFDTETEKRGIQFSFKNALLIKDLIIKSDKEKLYAILTNLVKNAIKFTNEGSIEFGCVKKGEFLEFYVKDSGVGIPQEQQKLIFKRFRQGSESLNRNYEGAGLGLSISKAYVKLLGGKIWVKSVEENLLIGKAGGSTFYFTISSFSEKKEIKVVENVVGEFDEKDQINNLKVLITEDDETTEKLIGIKIKKYSREVLIARNGVEAVQICRKNPDIDLILMDIKMPEMNGYEATKQIRLFNKKVIIVAQTAYAFMGDKEKSIETGFNDYISKPFKKGTFTDLLEKHFTNLDIKQ
jgi:signal transduction histidine kinase/ActR/RegA family two-component response regulator